jgi:hypothetical protein
MVFLRTAGRLSPLFSAIQWCWQTVAEIKEACATIRKAMVQINELSATMNAQNFNQMTRWVTTKEEHCCKIITTISGEFFCGEWGVLAHIQDLTHLPQNTACASA